MHEILTMKKELESLDKAELDRKLSEEHSDLIAFIDLLKNDYSEKIDESQKDESRRLFLLLYFFTLIIVAFALVIFLASTIKRNIGDNITFEFIISVLIILLVSIVPTIYSSFQKLNIVKARKNLAQKLVKYGENLLKRIDGLTSERKTTYADSP